MTTRRAVQADRRATNQITAALLTCVLALTLATLSRSPAGQHHFARAKVVVGVSSNDVQNAVARLDLHAVADSSSGRAGSQAVAALGNTSGYAPRFAHHGHPARARTSGAGCLGPIRSNPGGPR